jgi:hypothetical protein
MVLLITFDTQFGGNRQPTSFTAMTLPDVLPLALCQPPPRNSHRKRQQQLYIASSFPGSEQQRLAGGYGR